MLDLDPIPGILCVKRGYTLNGTPVHYNAPHTHTQISVHFGITNPPTCMFLGGWRTRRMGLVRVYGTSFVWVYTDTAKTCKTPHRYESELRIEPGKPGAVRQRRHAIVSQIWMFTDFFHLHPSPPSSFTCSSPDIIHGNDARSESAVYFPPWTLNTFFFFPVMVYTGSLSDIALSLTDFHGDTWKDESTDTLLFFISPLCVSHYHMKFL